MILYHDSVRSKKGPDRPVPERHGTARDDHARLPLLREVTLPFPESRGESAQPVLIAMPWRWRDIRSLLVILHAPIDDRDDSQHRQQKQKSRHALTIPSKFSWPSFVGDHSPQEPALLLRSHHGGVPPLADVKSLPCPFAIISSSDICTAIQETDPKEQAGR